MGKGVSAQGSNTKTHVASLVSSVRLTLGYTPAKMALVGQSTTTTTCCTWLHKSARFYRTAKCCFHTLNQFRLVKRCEKISGKLNASQQTWISVIGHVNAQNQMHFTFANRCWSAQSKSGRPLQRLHPEHSVGDNRDIDRIGLFLRNRSKKHTTHNDLEHSTYLTVSTRIRILSHFSRNLPFIAKWKIEAF